MSYPTQFYLPVDPSHYFNFPSSPRRHSPSPSRSREYDDARDDLDAQEAALQSQLARIHAAKEARARHIAQEQEAERARIRREVETEILRQKERERIEAEVRERIRQEELRAAQAKAKAAAEKEAKREAKRRAEEAKKVAIIKAINDAQAEYFNQQQHAYLAQQEQERQRQRQVALATARALAEEQAARRLRQQQQEEEQRQRAIREVIDAKRRWHEAKLRQRREKEEAGLKQFWAFLNGHSHHQEAQVPVTCFGIQQQPVKEAAKEEKKAEDENKENVIPLDEFLTRVFGVRQPHSGPTRDVPSEVQPKPQPQESVKEPSPAETSKPATQEPKAEKPNEFGKALEDFLTGVFQDAFFHPGSSGTPTTTDAKDVKKDEVKKEEQEQLKVDEAEKKATPTPVSTPAPATESTTHAASTPTPATNEGRKAQPEPKSEARQTPPFPFHEFARRVPFDHPAVHALTGMSEDNAKVAFDGLMEDLLGMFGVPQGLGTKSEETSSVKRGVEKQEQQEKVVEGKGKAKEVVQPANEVPAQPVYPTQTVTPDKEEVRPFEVHNKVEEHPATDQTIFDAEEYDVPESAADLANQKAQSTVEQIQSKYRENLLRVRRLEKLEALQSKLDKVESGFEFPSSLDFTPPTSSPSTPSLDPVDGSSASGDLPPVPALAFTPKNVSYHAHAQALLGLLVAADAISSDGDEEVRRVRKDFVKDVEGKLAQMERKRAEVWKKQHEEQETQKIAEKTEQVKEPTAADESEVAKTEPAADEQALVGQADTTNEAEGNQTSSKPTADLTSQTSNEPQTIEPAEVDEVETVKTPATTDDEPKVDEETELNTTPFEDSDAEDSRADVKEEKREDFVML